MKISFHGADQGVTGSCHLIECNGTRILIDCGLFQGGRELAEENAEAFGFEATDIDVVLLTHAHLDHCGRIPLLVKRGFQGEIISTAASRDLARLVMLDAAHLQEEEARYRARRAAQADGKRHHRHGGGDRDDDIEPLYTMLDAIDAMGAFGRTANYDESIEIASGVRATFIDAGHILGSASILLELHEGEQRRRVLFSGDLGYGGRAILRDPTPPPHADVVIMETTYGDRLHKQLEPSIEELYSGIEDTFRRGGNVVIPTFAMERAQEILYFLHEGVHSDRLSASTQVFLDSPMAISATEIFKRHPECFDAETRERFAHGDDPFALPGLHFTRETAESMALNQIRGGAVIMAGSGMCTGGRVRHHLRHNLWRTDSTVIFVGYAAHGTLARRIIDGASHVHLFREDIPVRARILTIGGFSAHADRDQLLAWHAATGHPKRTFLVHGDPEAMQAFARALPGHQVEMPARDTEYAL